MPATRIKVRAAKVKKVKRYCIQCKTSTSHSTPPGTAEADNVVVKCKKCGRRRAAKITIHDKMLEMRKEDEREHFEGLRRTLGVDFMP